MGRAPARRTRPPGRHRRAFGAKATRTVVGALATNLVQNPGTGAAGTDPSPPDGPAADRPVVGLLPLALALIGAPVLEPDPLARVLAQTELFHGPEVWPTGEQIAAGRSVVATLGPVRSERILCDAAARTDGPNC